MTGTRAFDSILRFAGWALVAVSAAFLVVVGRSHWAEVSAIALSHRQWLAIIGLALAYGFGLLLTGLVWHMMLVFTGAGPSDLRHSIRAHTSAQLAKYVPGNVFHFLGRHMIHRAAGMDDKRLALAAILENGMLVFAAACVAALCLTLGGVGIYRDIAAVAGAGLCVALIVVALWVRVAGRRLGPLLAAFLSAFCFFVVMAAAVAAIAMMLGAGFAWDLGGSGVAAWIAGFVAPGSPGGLGVREAAMVLLGGRVASPDLLLMTALLFRVVTFGGDIVCALAGRVLFRDRAPTRECAA